MKYPDVKLGDVEAVWNKFGGTNGVASFLRGEINLCPGKVQIQRDQFDPKRFIHKGVSRYRDYSVQAGSIDLSQLELYPSQENGFEGKLLSECMEMLSGIGLAGLGADEFYTLWNNPVLIPPGWRKQTEGDKTFIFFPGTVLMEADSKFILSMWADGGKFSWRFDTTYIEINWKPCYKFAVLREK